MAQTATGKEIKIQDIKPGMTIRVHQKITEVSLKSKKDKDAKDKERIQVFEGMVIARKHGNSTSATFTVRKVSQGIGVEKIFPIHSPTIVKITAVKQANVKRAKLYYLRNYKKKLREKKL